MFSIVLVFLLVQATFAEQSALCKTKSFSMRILTHVLRCLTGSRRSLNLGDKLVRKSLQNWT